MEAAEKLHTAHRTSSTSIQPQTKSLRLRQQAADLAISASVLLCRLPTISSRQPAVYSEYCSASIDLARPLPSDHRKGDIKSVNNRNNRLHNFCNCRRKSINSYFEQFGDFFLK